MRENKWIAPRDCAKSLARAEEKESVQESAGERRREKGSNYFSGASFISFSAPPAHEARE